MMQSTETGDKSLGDRTTLVNRGIFQKLELPESFQEVVMPCEQPFGYLEFESKNSMAMICFEATDESFDDDSINLVQKALDEKFAVGKGRPLEPTTNADDQDLFNILSFCFVFGGFLTRGGTVMDIDRCHWELRSIGDETESKTAILGRLKFVEGSGKRSKREVLVVLPRAPAQKGCGYIWLEGNGSDLRRHERPFLAAIGRASLLG